MKKDNILTLTFSMLLPLVVGAISSMISSKGMLAYGTMNKPPLSPPAWVFPVAWTILYLMMGLSSYYIVISDAAAGNKIVVLALYALQLAMNFLWSIIFFNLGMYKFAFIWLLLMLFVILACAFRFYSIRRISAYLLIPYILWMTFAGYLNLGAAVLN